MIAGVEIKCPPHWSEEEAGYGVHWETAKKIAFDNKCDIDFVEFPLSYIVSGEQEVALEVRKKIESYLEQAVIAEGGNARYLARQTIGFFKELFRRIFFLLTLLFNFILKLLHIERKTKIDYIPVPEDEENDERNISHNNNNNKNKKKNQKKNNKAKKNN